MQLITIAAAFALLTVSLPPRAPLGEMAGQVRAGSLAAPFHFEDGILTVTADLITLKIHGGEIVYLRDNRTGETFADSYGYPLSSRDRPGGPGFLSKTDQGRTTWRSFGPASAVTYSHTGPTRATLTYSAPDQADATLRLETSIDGKSGEIVIRATAIDKNQALSPDAIDAPVANFRTRSMILGNGAKYNREEVPAQDQTSNPDLGRNAPTVAVIEGTRGIVAWSAETAGYPPNWIRMDHSRDRDYLALHTKAGGIRSDRQSLESASLRISVHSSWTQAARRWRERFEERTGAKPLWLNRAGWIRRIHAVFNAMNNGYDAGSPKFDELARVADPASVLYFLWTGDRLVLFGDPKLVARIQRPRADELETVARYGWPLMLYHPYLLIYSEKGERDRIELLSRRGWLPDNYSFEPRFAGSPEEWRNHWAGFQTAYHDSRLSLLHPASKRVSNYLVQNVEDYTTRHGAQALYFDILGADDGRLFPLDRRLVEGYDFPSGESRILHRLVQELPDLGIMSEYQSPETLPFTFYSWEGPATRKATRARSPYRLNHPLRTALIGSYCWTREDNAGSPDDIESALMGALPEVSLAGDYRVDPDRARWSQARARLHCEEGLFHDVPDYWAPDVFAYYRAHDGSWFAFKRIGSSYGYVHILADGTEVLRLLR